MYPQFSWHGRVCFGHADATKINEILGSSTAELLVRVLPNSTTMRTFLSATQQQPNSDTSSTADLLQLLGLEIDGATTMITMQKLVVT